MVPLENRHQAYFEQDATENHWLCSLYCLLFILQNTPASIERSFQLLGRDVSWNGGTATNSRLAQEDSPPDPHRSEARLANTYFFPADFVCIRVISESENRLPAMGPGCQHCSNGPGFGI